MARIYKESGYRIGDYHEVAVIYDATKTEATKLAKQKYGKDVIVKKSWPGVSYFSVYSRK